MNERELLLKQLYQLSLEDQKLDSEITRLKNQRLPLIKNVTMGQESLARLSKDYLEIKSKRFSPKIIQLSQDYSEMQSKTNIQRRFNLDQQLIQEKQKIFIRKPTQYTLFSTVHPQNIDSNSKKLLKNFSTSDLSSLEASIDSLENKISKTQTSLKEVNQKLETEQNATNIMNQECEVYNKHIAEIPKLQEKIQELENYCSNEKELIREQNLLNARLKAATNYPDELPVNPPEITKTTQQLQIEELESEIDALKQGIQKCEQSKLLMLDLIIKASKHK